MLTVTWYPNVLDVYWHHPSRGHLVVPLRVRIGGCAVANAVPFGRYRFYTLYSAWLSLPASPRVAASPRARRFPGLLAFIQTLPLPDPPSKNHPNPFLNLSPHSQISRLEPTLYLLWKAYLSLILECDLLSVVLLYHSSLYLTCTYWRAKSNSLTI